MRPFDCGGQRFNRVATRDREHAGTFLRESKRDCATDTRTRTGDRGELAFESAHARLSSP